MSGWCFPTQVTRLFAQAGWTPGRHVAGSLELPASFDFPPCVLAFLHEYGGLVVGDDFQGVDWRRSTLSFQPALAEGQHSAEGAFGYYATLLHRPLFPLGLVVSNGCFLATDREYRLYTLKDQCCLVADTLVEGISHLLLGTSSQVEAVLDEDSGSWKR